MSTDVKSMNVGLWMVLTTLGLAGGLIAGLLVGMPLGRIANAMVVTVAVTCCVGAVLGSLQAVGLRDRLSVPLWWVVATIVGVGAGLAVGVVVVEQAGILATGARPNIARIGSGMRALSLFVVGLTTGAFLGGAQLLVVKRQLPVVRHWLAVTTLGLALAFGTSSLIVDLVRLRFASPAGAIVFLLLSGIGFGAITSWPLRRAA
jgi:hypothetical protein